MNDYTQADYEQIDAYLSGRLPEAEAQKFQQRLQSDADWATEVEAYQTLESRYRLLGRRDWLHRINEQLKQEEPENGQATITPFRPLATQDGLASAGAKAASSSSANRSFWPGAWAMAAAVAGLLLGGYWLLNRPEGSVEPTAQTPVVNSPRSSSAPQPSLREVPLLPGTNHPSPSAVNAPTDDPIRGAARSGRRGRLW